MQTPSTRARLARIAEALAATPLRGDNHKAGRDLEPILSHFPRPDPNIGFDWCAAFVYHCCVAAGFRISVRYPELPCNVAGVIAWLCWAKLPRNRFYSSARSRHFGPMRGDLVVYDGLLADETHDHIGVVLRVTREELITAEGNVANVSGIFRRKRNRRVRGFIRISDHGGAP